MKLFHGVMLFAIVLTAGCSGPSASNSETVALERSHEAVPQRSLKHSRVAPLRPEANTSGVTLPEGATLRVRTTHTLSTKSAETGQSFTATLVEPLIAGGRVIAPEGAQVDGKVIDSDDGGKVKGRARITVALTALHTSSGIVPISTGTVGREARATKKKDAMKIGIGAGIGAAIGAIAGGGKGAAIGAGAGGGAGTGVVLATKGDPAVIPAESVLTFRLRAPATVPSG